MDTDPGGPKTSGSGSGSGSPTLGRTSLTNCCPLRVVLTYMQAYQQQAAHQQEAESEAGAVASPPSPPLGLLEDTAGSSGTADESLEAAMHSLDIQQLDKFNF